jgi:topoisomerase IA-like protein
VQVGEYRQGEETLTASVPEELGREGVTLDVALELLDKASQSD